MKNILIALILLSPIFANAQTFIAESVQSTATERNNARLIAEDNNGDLHVVYYDNGIYYSFSDDAGETWSLPFYVDNIGRNPSIAFDNNNILHLAYKYGGTTAYDIVHRTYDFTSWSETDIIHNDASSPVSRPVLAIDSEGNLHCVFQRAGCSLIPNSEIWYNKFTHGVGWGTSQNISNSYGASEYPTLTVDNDDNVYAFWKDSGEDINNDKMVLYRKYTVGIGWDADYINISNTTGNGSYATMDPSVVTDITGDIHLVWKDSEPGNREILYKKCTNGVWDVDYINISNTAEASAHPIISTDYLGNLHVFWAEKIGNVYYEIVYKKYDAELEIWSDITNISNTASVESEYPNSPANINNSVSVIWTEGDTSPFSVTYYGELLPVGINEFDNNTFSLNLFPNPTTGIFTIQGKIIQSIEITNVNGQVIYSYDDSKALYEYQVDLSNQAKGIYFVKVKAGEFFYTEKIVLIK